MRHPKTMRTFFTLSFIILPLVALAAPKKNPEKAKVKDGRIERIQARLDARAASVTAAILNKKLVGDEREKALYDVQSLQSGITDALDKKLDDKTINALSNQLKQINKWAKKDRMELENLQAMSERQAKRLEALLSNKLITDSEHESIRKKLDAIEDKLADSEDLSPEEREEIYASQREVLRDLRKIRKEGLSEENLEAIEKLKTERKDALKYLSNCLMQNKINNQESEAAKTELAAIKTKINSIYTDDDFTAEENTEIQGMIRAYRTANTVRCQANNPDSAATATNGSAGPGGGSTSAQ